MKPMLITFEGIDGSGKSSLAQNIFSALSNQGYPVKLTKEFGGTPLGQTLRTILHTQKDLVCDTAEFLLIAADRAQHFHEVVVPSLQAGMIVLSDRMADSSLAYQGYGRGIDCAMIEHINAWAMQGISPTITFFLRIQPEQALTRVRSRNEQLTSFEQEKLDFWHRVADGYEKIFAQRKNVITLDGNLPQQDVFNMTLNVITEQIKQ